MPCPGCGTAAPDLMFGWLPTDANGDPEQNDMLIPPLEDMTLRIDLDPEEDQVELSWSTASWMILVASYGNTYTVRDFITNHPFPGTGASIDPELDGVSSGDFGAVKFTVQAPGTGEAAFTGQSGDCDEVTPLNCSGVEPCTGSAKLRINLTDGLFGDVYYSSVCEGGQQDTSDPDPGEDPSDPDTGAATPAATGTSPQKPVGHPDSGGSPDMSKIAIEIPFGDCGCTNSIVVKIQDKNGNDLKATSPIDGQSFSAVLMMNTLCDECYWVAPPPPIPVGVCCYEELEHKLCCRENLTELQCETLADIYGTDWGWKKDGDCQDCPVGDAPPGDYEECEEEN
jgi:hypothetical protein